MQRSGVAFAWLMAAALLISACIPDATGAGPDSADKSAARTLPIVPVPAVIEEPPPTKTVREVLENGVLITISLASQQMHVFRNGVLWRSSPVSTGKRGKETPTGVFAILQKKKFHRSNLYSNAPMPFMQRLTWDGIAIHAGRLPGYPASHGCIRIPRTFASELFQITGSTTTAVIVVDEALAGDVEALVLARRMDAFVPIDPALLRRTGAALAGSTGKPSDRLPAARTIELPNAVESEAPPVAPPANAVRSQTIQLAAALTPRLAAAQWAEFSARRPELQGMQMEVIPAMVNGTQYYRLRASAADAHAKCRALKRAGIDCFPVN